MRSIPYGYASDDTKPDAEIKALMRQTLDQFEEYAMVTRRIAIEGVSFLRQIEDPSKLADTIASNIIVKTSVKKPGVCK